MVQVESASQELEELREMKEDVERRERAQATVIENQAKRLDELETLYKVCPTSPQMRHAKTADYCSFLTSSQEFARSEQATLLIMYNLLDDCQSI